MKTFLKWRVPGLLLFVVLSGPAFGQTRLATVSMQKVFDKYWKTQQGDAQLKERVAEIDKYLKDMGEDWKKAKEDWQKLLASANDQAVSAAEREKRKKAAEDKLMEVKRMDDSITQTQREANAKLIEQRAQMRKKLVDEIRAAIASKAKAGGFALVIDSDAKTVKPEPGGIFEMPTLLYSSGENDLTDAVLAQLNAAAPLDIVKPDDTKLEPKDGKKPGAEEKAAGSKDGDKNK